MYVFSINATLATKGQSINDVLAEEREGESKLSILLSKKMTKGEGGGS